MTDPADKDSEPTCLCCAEIRDVDGVPAIYWWTATITGRDIPLCVECCAGWREAAATGAHPEFVPARIRLIGSKASPSCR